MQLPICGDRRRRGHRLAHAVALPVALVVALAPTVTRAGPEGSAAAAAVEPPVASARADVDGDGAADTIEVIRPAGVTVTTAAGASAWKPFGHASHELARGEISTGSGVRFGGRSVIVASALDATGRGEAMVLAWKAGGLELLWSGVVGPVGRDGEHAVTVAATEHGVLRYQHRGDVSRCDGAPAYLFPEKLDGTRFRPVTKTVGVADDAPVLSASRTAPAGLDAASAPSAGVVFRASAASIVSGASNAGELLPPRAIDDGDPATAWREDRGGDGRGDFVSFSATLPGAAVRTLRIIPGDAASAASFRGQHRLKRIALVAPGVAYWIDFPTDPGRATDPAAPWWVELPQPLAASCVSLVLGEVYPGGKGADTAIAEVALLTDIELARGGAEVALVARVSSGGADSDAAARLLGRRGTAAAPALLAALAGQGLDAAARLRLLRALADGGDPSGAAALVEALSASGLSDSDRERFADALRRQGAAALPPLAALLADPSAAEVARHEAATALGAIADPAAALALRGAAGHGSRELRRHVVDLLGARPLGELTALIAAAQEVGATAGEGALGAEADLWRAVGIAAGRADAKADVAAAVTVMSARLDQAFAYELRYRLLAGLAGLADVGAVAAVERSLAGLDASGGDPTGGADGVSARGVVDRPAATAQANALRAVAASGLAGNPLSEARTLLRDLLTAADPGVRGRAAAALADQPGAALADRADAPDAADDTALAARLADDHWPAVRRTAATALARRCHRAAPAAALVAAVDGDADVDVSRESLAALVACRADGIDARLVALARDGDRPLPLREKAVALIGALGDGALADEALALFARFRSAAWGSADALRLAALTAITLGKLPATGATATSVNEALLAAAREPSFPELQAAAVAALGERCPPAATALFTQLARSDERTVALAAGRARSTCKRR